MIVLKRLKFLFCALLFPLLALSVSAAETVVCEKDFSDPDLSDFSRSDGFTVKDGVLRLGSGSGSAFLTYEIPEIYRGLDFRVDVDFLGHTSTGGILIGGSGSQLTASPVSFFGYDCFIGNNGKKGALGCYKENGTWSGNIVVGADTITEKDVHLQVSVRDGTLTYTVTSLDGSTRFFGVTYDIGTSTRDVYDAFSGTVGLRKFYADGGVFDNFRVSVQLPDEIPELDQKIGFCGLSLVSDGGLSAESSALTGSGTALTENALTENFSASFLLTAEKATAVYFGMQADGSGYVFTLDPQREIARLTRITPTKCIWLAEKNLPFYNGAHTVTVTVTDKTASLTYDAFSVGEAAFPTFDMYLADYRPGQFGMRLDGGKSENLKITEAVAYTGDTYKNPVAWGADPDVLFYDGTYYLYNRVSAGSDIFRVSTSPDLVHWTVRGPVFSLRAEYTAKSYMSPNVFYHDGIFYLFYAAKNTEGSNRIYYATSDSPLGPFIGQTQLHDVAEIGGHPFCDDDGKLYMSYVRFGGGNFIWLEEVTMKDGVVTPVAGTLTLVVSPTEPYEIDGYGLISEGGVLYKHNGYYYMIYATGHYKGHYGEGYAVSENILGPYTKYAYNDILTYNSAVDGVGDGIFVPSPDGTELYMVYHSHFSTSAIEPRYTRIDKVAFVQDPDGGPDILTVRGPSTTAVPVPSDRYRYDFDQSGRSGITDLLALLRYTSGDRPYCGTYDVNLDGKVDEKDVSALVKEILNQKP